MGRLIGRTDSTTYSTFHRRSCDRLKISRLESQSVLHCPAGRVTPDFISTTCLPHYQESALAKPPNFKQEKKRREDAQKKKNEAKQRENVARKDNVVRAPPKP